MEPEELLVVAQVSHQYASGFCLNNFDITVSPGEVVGVIGPNGSGKTTALYLAAGLLEPESGAVTISGCSLQKSPLAAKRLLSFVPDLPTGFDHLTALEYCRLYGALRGEDAGHQGRVEVVSSVLGLEPYGHRCLGELSHGTRRKVALAAGFASAAPLLMLDEVTSALDPESVLVLRGLLAERRGRGSAVLLATQDLHFAEQVCDRVSLLVDGRFVDGGTLEELRGRYDSLDLYDVFSKAIGLSDQLASLHETVRSAFTR